MVALTWLSTQGGVPAALLAALDTAIDSYIGTKRAQQQRLEEMKRLEETAQSGKRTVQSVQAQNKIKELEGQEFSQKFAEMRALKAKKEAELVHYRSVHYGAHTTAHAHGWN
jgi:hypothetical protein